MEMSCFFTYWEHVSLFAEGTVAFEDLEDAEAFSFAAPKKALHNLCLQLWPNQPWDGLGVLEAQQLS
jgi:hypothetical protein